MSIARSLAAGFCAVTVLGLAAPTYAETRAVRDPAGDVVMFGADDAPPVPAPDRSDIDIRKLQINYTADRISGLLTFADLQRPDRRLVMAVELRWGPDLNNDLAELKVTASKAHPEGVGGFGFPSDHCPATYSIDYVRNRLRFSVPASCVGESPWLRASALAVVRGAQHSHVAWYDSAPKKYGQRIHRG